ncbi:MAG: hypothetical protein ACXVB4_08810 [Pseudobdellovibrionaceae bacterium]
MIKEQWQEHFKDQIKSAEALYSKDSTNVSLLLFCLRAKIIPVKIYLEWAKENYQLPLLSEKFFQTFKAQSEFYKKWQALYKWSPECLPIAEWDGSLIVACLQIPEGYRNTTPTIFVLASHEVLDPVWETYQKSPLANEVDFTDMSALAATVIATREEVDFFNSNGEINLQDKAEKDSAEALPEEDSEKLEFPQGSSAGEGHSPEGLVSASPLPPLNLTPLSLKKTEEAPKVQEVQDVQEVQEVQDVQQAPEVQVVKEAEAPLSAVIENSIPERKPRSVQPLLILKAESEIKTNSDGEEAEQLLPTSATYSLEKIRQQGQDKFDREVLTHFQILKTFFTKSILLAVDNKGQLVKPIVWDKKDFAVQEQQNSCFNLETPSIFRIVSSTQKPYHGFVILNDLNESFFESWNHGQIPDHVTIVPLFEGELVVGMLMGFGEKSSFNKTVLQFTEKVAKDFSQKIFKGTTFKVA